MAKGKVFIGNIVTKGRVKHSMFMNVVRDIHDIVPNIPTLIVGWEIVKEIYGKNRPLVLDKEIDTDLWWTFSRSENRRELELDYSQFYRTALDRITKKYDYQFFDVLTCSFGEAREMIKYLLSEEGERYCYVKDLSFMYVMDNEKKIITGISLDGLEYIGIPYKKVLLQMYNCKHNAMFRDDTFIPYSIKRIIGDNNLIIPYLYQARQG